MLVKMKAHLIKILENALALMAMLWATGVQLLMKLTLNYIKVWIKNKEIMNQKKY